jgi:hypothetical protein
MNSNYDDVKAHLRPIYALIKINPQDPFDRDFDDSIFDLVDAFLEEYEASDYMKLIMDCSTDENIHKIGCLLDILIWSTSDNGKKLDDWRMKAFENENQRDIEVALCVTNTYPMTMNDIPALIKKLHEIEIKFPDTKPLCDYWMIAAQKYLDREQAQKSRNSIQYQVKKILEGFQKMFGLKK